MPTALSFGARLTLIAALPLLALLTIGGLALSELRENQRVIATIVADRVVPLRQIKQVSDAFAVDLVDQVHKVRDHSRSPSQARVNIEAAIQTADRQWQAYLGTYLIDAEHRLVAEIEPLLARAHAAAKHADELMAQQDIEALNRWAAAEMYPLVDPLTEKLSALSKVQEEESERLEAERQLKVERVMQQFAAALLITLLCAGAAAWVVMRRTTRGLSLATRTAMAAAEGRWELAPPSPPSIDSSLAMLMTAVESIRDQLNYSNHQMTALLRVLPMPILAIPTEGSQIRDANPAFEHRFAVSRSAVVGRSLGELPLELQDDSRLNLVNSLRSLQAGEHVVTDITVSGHAGVEHFEVSPLLRAERGGNTLLLAFEDVTHRRRQEQALRSQAERDPLTGLLNRAGMQAALDDAWAAWQAEKLPLALVLVDLDGFKPINDELGHAAGDEALVTVAQRLQQTLRTGDLAARWGGDEFVLLLPNCPSLAVATQVSERVLAALSADMPVGGESRRIGASLGVAHSAEADLPEQGAHHLLGVADRRMYAAKASGRHQVVSTG